MRIVLILLFLTVSSLVFGQSAKKIIKQLSVQLLLEHQKQDSAYAIFQKAKKEYDSIRSLITGKTLRLSMEYGLAERSGELFFTRRSQLEDLGLDADAVAAPLTKTDGLPDFKQVLAPIDKSFMKAEEFDKVPNSFSHDTDAKQKELIVIVRKKLIEYQDHERSNEVRLITMERNGEQLASYLPVMDSLSRVYSWVNEELEVKNRKLREKLRELRINYKEKGPKGFPEGYQKVFPNLFRSADDGPVYQDPEYLQPEPASPKMDIYTVVDEEAQYPGGNAAMKRYLFENIHYPEIAKELRIDSKHVVQFVVLKDGSISDAWMKKPITDCPECDAEIIRVVKSMPKWIPAKINGKSVNSWFVLPVYIHLD